MSFALTSFRKDMARWRLDVMATIIWISIPLLIGGLITILMASGVRPHGLLLLVDEDGTLLSELVVSAYSAGELGELIAVEKTGYQDGLARVNDGDASALLIIPDGFMHALFESTPVTLTLRTNPSQRILPGIITDVTEILLDAGFYVHQLFGDEISAMTGMQDGPSDAQVAALAVAIQRKLEAVGPGVFPPVIDLEIVEPPPKEPSPPLALLFMPGIVLMAVLFSANGLASDYWRERELGTLRRLVAAPSRLGAFVAGKTLAAAAIIGIVGGLTLVLGYVYHGVAWSKLPSSLTWICLSGVTLFAWFSLLQMSFGSRKTANVISNTVMFPLLMAGGSFFPLAVMPGWMAAVGRVAPNGFVADRLTKEITAATPWAIDLSSWGIVIAALGAGLGLCVLRLRAGFARA